MGTRAHDGGGARGDGLGVKAPPVRVALLAAAALALAYGSAAGLVRLGLAVPEGGVAREHGALMVSGFLGTVISLERAVALGRRWALAAPLAGATGTGLVLAGLTTAGHAAWIVAALLLLVASVAIARRQLLPHTALLVVAAAAWAVGNGLLMASRIAPATAWWFAFLALTIAAERLELTRLLPRKRGSRATFTAACALLLAGAALGVAAPAAGAIAFGAALVALAAWLARYDIAWRTRKGTGFARYAALSLLGGYAWLAAGGVAWALSATAWPGARDAALHAVGLGFVGSMILGHAPLVVPAIAKARLAYTPAFYVPLALLHASVLVRVAGGLHEAAWRSLGGALNVLTLAVFAATIAMSLRRAGRAPAPAREVESRPNFPRG